MYIYISLYRYEYSYMIINVCVCVSLYTIDIYDIHPSQPWSVRLKGEVAKWRSRRSHDDHIPSEIYEFYVNLICLYMSY